MQKSCRPSQTLHAILTEQKCSLRDARLDGGQTLSLLKSFKQRLKILEDKCAVLSV